MFIVSSSGTSCPRNGGTLLIHANARARAHTHTCTQILGQTNTQSLVSLVTCSIWLQVHVNSDLGRCGLNNSLIT